MSFTASALRSFLKFFSLKTALQALFLQEIPRVPLNVPQLGHFLIPGRKLNINYYISKNIFILKDIIKISLSHICVKFIINLNI